MKKYLIPFLILIFPSYSLIKQYFNKPVIELGDINSNKIWIYLEGLTSNFYIDGLENRKLLDKIGKNLNIKFLAIVPKNRCPKLNNALCWPSDNEKELKQTYEQILNGINGQKISGLIGFSNGGFFLNYLTQFYELKVPVISIGSAGRLINPNSINKIYLLIGKKDEWHYKYAMEFYNSVKNAALKINLIEYDEGHIIPSNLLEKLLKDLN